MISRIFSLICFSAYSAIAYSTDIKDLPINSSDFWTGPSIVYITQQTVYTYNDGQTYSNVQWNSSHGTVINSSVSGTTYSVTIEWTATGSTDIDFIRNGDVIVSSKLITSNAIPVPATTFSTQSKCGNSIVRRNSTPPSFFEWYWQTSSAGTSTTLGNLDSVVVTTSGNLYLRARLISAPYTWSASSQSVGNITVATTPVTPATANHAHYITDAPVTASLSVSAVSGADSYRWYLHSVNNNLINGVTTTSYSPQLSETKTYYVEAVKTTGSVSCVSSPRKAVTANIYPKPKISTTDGAINMGTSALLAVNNFSYDTYQWISLNTSSQTKTSISGETDTVFSTGETGTFMIRVTKGSAVDTTNAFVVGRGASGQEMNYVVSNTIQRAGVLNESDVDTLMVKSNTQVIAYLDDLGRPLQTVTTQGSPLKKDMVNPSVYDGFGREYRKYLPVVAAAASGWYKKAIIDEHGNYTGLAGNVYKNNMNGRIAQDTIAYSEIIFETSPLNRPLKQYNVGAVSSVSGNDKYVRNEYPINIHGTSASASAEKIIAWELNSSGMPVRKTAVTNFIAANGYYSSRQLEIKETTDEEGNMMREYTNKQGQIILKKAQALIADSSNLNSVNGWSLTYYVYDKFGNLRFVIPPELSKIAHGSDTSIMNSTRLNNWAFQYTYDARQRMISKKIPGAGTVYMVYDRRDRLVATQDANQRTGANKYWSFTKYDELNRPILSGIKDTAAALTQAQMQAVVDSFYVKPWAKLSESYIGTSSGNVHGYSNKSYPVITGPATTNDANRYLSATYYDNYNVKSIVSDTSRYSFKANHLSGQDAGYVKRLKGQVTATKVKVLDGGVTGGYTWLASINYYDDDYRPIQIISDNYKGGTDRITNVYDFVGKVLQTQATHEEYDVQWATLTGSTVSGNILKRSVSGNGYGSSSAFSKQQLAANSNGWVEVPLGEISSRKAIGLASSNPDANYTSIDYCFLQYFGTLYIIEAGVTKQSYADVLGPGDVLRIERTGTTIAYKRNGITLWSHSVGSTPALNVDASLYTSGTTLVGVRASFGSNTHTVNRSFDYDHGGRVINVWHKLDSEDQILLVQNVYNELGQLVDKKLHSNDGETFEQSIDYTYNIKGWVTSINDAHLSTDSNDDAKDLFGMELLYYETDAAIGNSPLYNGNISAIKWSNNLTLGDIKQNAYVYSYDPLNRIKSSSYKENELSLWTTAANYGNNETGFSYDLNGNIKTLQRNDRRSSGWMDNLSYDYGTGNAYSNKLLKVTDAGDKTKGFVDGLAGNDDYVYDNNGNLIWDRNKGGAEILTNGSFDSGNANWTLANSGRLTFTSGEVQIAAGAAVSTLKQSVVSAGKPYVITIEMERTAGTITVYAGNTAATSFSSTGVHTVTVSSTGNSDFTISAGTTFAGKIKSISLKGVTVITYNLMNLPEIVTRPGDKQLQYIYDASGKKLRQEVSTNTIIEKTTDYVGEYIYENDTLQFINHEEGRIVPGLNGAEGWEYQYHLKDHLGNVRMTFTSKHEVDTAIASMETANVSDESGEFIYYNEAVKINSTLFDHTNSGTTHYAVRLTGTSTERYGLAKSLSVMPGDTIRASVFAKYLDTNSGNWTTALNNLMTAIANNTAPAGTVVDGGLAGSTGGATPSFASLLDKAEESGAAPKAYLNFLVFDRRDTLIDGGFVRVSSAAREYGQDDAHEELFKEIAITQAGYVYIYLSNDNVALGGSVIEVFFDDFTVEHVKSAVLQQNDYYAFGLDFNSASRENFVENRYRYNQGVGERKFNTERIGELGLNIDLTKYRAYDPASGRWWQVDPLADESDFTSLTPYNYSFNNPIRYNDPYGDCPFCVIPLILEGLAALTATEVAVGATVVVGGAATLTFREQIWEAMGNASPYSTPSVDFAQSTGGVRDLPSNNQNQVTMPNGSQLPKPGKGKGSVPPEKRDPKRVATEKEKQKMLDERGNKCEGCDKPATTKEVKAHHKKRHADGGKTKEKNLTNLCDDCHNKVHEQKQKQRTGTSPQE